MANVNVNVSSRSLETQEKSVEFTINKVLIKACRMYIFYHYHIYKYLFTKLVVAKKTHTYIFTVKGNETKENTASKYASLL